MAAGNNEIWTVLLNAEKDATKTKTYRISNITTVAELKAKWSQDVAVSVEKVLIKTIGGGLADDLQTLIDIGEVSPGVKVVNLLVDIIPSFRIGMYRGKAGDHQVSIPLSACLEDVQPRIRQLFNISAEQQFRVRTIYETLLPDVPLSEQGIDTESSLLVDLGSNVEVKEAWSCAITEHEVFSSDLCWELIDQDAIRLQRLFLDRKEIDLNDHIIDALIPSKRGRRFVLELQTMQNITLATDRFLAERFVWPTDRLERIIPKRSLSTMAFMFENDLIGKTTALGDLNLPDCALLHDSPIMLRVKLRNGKHCVVHVPRLGCVADVEEIVRSVEKSDEFSLRCRGHILKSEESVGHLNGDTLEVVGSRKTIKVTFADRSVCWQTPEESLRFSGITREAALRSQLEPDSVLGKTLCCQGCGRSLCLEREQYQAVPVACCEVRSLWLIEPVPPITKDVSTQGPVYRPKHAVHRSVEVCTEVEQGERKLQVSILRGPQSLNLSVRSSDTLGALMTFLRNCRLFMGIKDISVSDEDKRRSLMTEPEWRERTLAECGVAPGAELKIHPVRYSSVRVAVYVPTQLKALREFNVHIPSPWSYMQVVSKAVERRTGLLVKSILVWQLRYCYLLDGKRRQSVSVFDLKSKAYTVIDEDNGVPADDMYQRTHMILDFLQAGSGISASVSHLPALNVYTSIEVCVSTDGRLLPADQEVLCDPRAILLFDTLVLRLGEDKIAHFLHLCDGQFINVETGDIYYDRETVTNAMKELLGDWSQTLILVMAGDPLPRYRLPPDVTVAVSSRYGVDVEVTADGRAVTQGDIPLLLSTSRWITTNGESDLEEAVTHAIRQVDQN